jgi:hypothetical protein
MTPRELAKTLRRAHRDRYGDVTDRPDREDTEAAVAEAEEILAPGSRSWSGSSRSSCAGEEWA